LRVDLVPPRLGIGENAIEIENNCAERHDCCICYSFVASCRSCSAKLRPRVANEQNGFAPSRVVSVLTFHFRETGTAQARSFHGSGEFFPTVDSCRERSENSNSRRTRFSWTAGG